MARKKYSYHRSPMGSGYVKVYRRIFDQDMKGDMPLQCVWFFLLAHARTAPDKIKYGYVKVNLAVGQTLLGERTISDEFGISRSVTRRVLTYLVNSNRIELEKNRAGTVITIVNFEKYYPKLYEAEPHTEPGNANNETGIEQESDHDRTTIEHRPLYKKERKKELKNTYTKSKKYSPEDFELAKRWLEALRSQKSTTTEIETAADTIRKLQELDKRTPDQLATLFEFVKSDDFWSKNAVSPSGLRKRSANGLTKIENIEAAMTQRTQRSTQAQNSQQHLNLTPQERRLVEESERGLREWRAREAAKAAKLASEGQTA